MLFFVILRMAYYASERSSHDLIHDFVQWVVKFDTHDTRKPQQ